jgi:adenosine kinase
MYSSAFFISSNFEALKKFAIYASENSILFGFNLSAVFLIEFHLNEILEILPYCDFVFCNEHEGAAFASKMGWTYENLI